MKPLRQCPIFAFLLCAAAALCGAAACTRSASKTRASASAAAPSRETPAAFRLRDSVIALLQPGDILLRAGADATSDAFRSLNFRDRTFSHCGVVAFEEGNPVVYHAIGGSDNPEARLRRDDPARFLSPVGNNGGGIARLATPNTALRAAFVAAVQRYHAEGRPFDVSFDLATDSALYCAEAVAKAGALATGDTLFFPRSRIGAFQYVAVDNLYGPGAPATLVCSFRYK